MNTKELYSYRNPYVAYLAEKMQGRTLTQEQFLEEYFAEPHYIEQVVLVRRQSGRSNPLRPRTPSYARRLFNSFVMDNVINN